MTITTKPVIWVEGIIAAGKSTLAALLAEHFKLRLLTEPVDSNPYLEMFYDDPKRWAFPMQIELLARRYAMQKEAAYGAVSPDNNWKGFVLDRGLPGDRVFCRLHMLAGNMSNLEWETYQRHYEIMTCSLTPPSLMLFLDVDPSVAFERVQKRKRGAEANVTVEYLNDVRKGYLDLISEIHSNLHPWAMGLEVKVIPWNVDNQPVDPILQYLEDKFHFSRS